jgi:hypothetical protein
MEEECSTHVLKRFHHLRFQGGRPASEIRRGAACRPLDCRTLIRPTLTVLLAIALSGCSLLGPKEPLKPSGPIDPKPGEVVLQWKGNPHLKGFNIYRRSENGNPIRVNKNPVKSLKSYTGGKQLLEFEYLDRGVLAGETYYYTLEEIDENGKTSMYETPISKTATPTGLR